MYEGLTLTLGPSIPPATSTNLQHTLSRTWSMRDVWTGLYQIPIFATYSVNIDGSRFERHAVGQSR